MSFDQQKHDLKNAVLFLETFPDILKQQLRADPSPDSEDLKEILDILRAKVAVIKERLPK